MKIKRTLISVSDKTNLENLVKKLSDIGIEIVSTGRTKKFIKNLGINVIDISDFTGFQEILDGRVKTLHPKVHGGILYKRDNDLHKETIKKFDILDIDMVIVNFYPFMELVNRQKLGEKFSLEEMIENIDIGGPSMLRSAAKNYKDVLPICDINDYNFVIRELEQNGDVSNIDRMKFAAKVFSLTSNYDYYINQYLQNIICNKNEGKMPNNFLKNFEKKIVLRYGENPGQNAGFYMDIINNKFPFKILGGKELSYNNFLDLEASFNLVNEFSEPACAIIKHTNPCGMGIDKELVNAYKKAFFTDKESAFGGIVAFNKKVTKDVAEEIIKIFTECVIAPYYEDEAVEILKQKKNLRIIEIDLKEMKKSFDKFDYKRVFNGFLIEERDFVDEGIRKLMTNRILNDFEKIDLEFAFKVVKHVKSNAILLVKNKMIIGIGAGQMSRIDSVEIAINKAIKNGFDLNGAVLASDAFFPFRDSIDKISEFGIKAVIEPGGSIRDQEVIDACNEKDISLIFTNERHFRH